MNLIEIVTKAGLEVLENGKIEFSGDTFDYLKANKKVNNIQYPDISRYVFVELNENNIKKLKLDKGVETFKEFQQLLLSSMFFSYKDDLRWNIYLYLIICEGIQVNDLSISEVISDDNFARKYFITYNELYNLLRRDDYYQKNNDIKSIKNPLTEWVDNLHENHLTGVLNDKFRTKPVTDYIYDGIPFDADFIKNCGREHTDSISEELRPIHINKIELGDFRGHCLKNKVIDVELVNLIHGANGSGKTSVLECVELAATNKIKRLNDLGQGLENISAVKVICSSSKKPIELTSNKSTAMCKKLDLAWYGTPVGVGQCTTFNPNFNHFNNFSAESAYNFASNESKKGNDYHDKFSRLLYDDSVVAIEKTWKRYREEFYAEKKKLHNDIASNDADINFLKNQIEKTNIDSINTNIIKNNLAQIKYKYEISDNDDTYNGCIEVQEVFNRLNPIVEKLSKDLVNFGVDTISSIKTKIEMFGSRLSDLENEQLENQTIKNSIEQQVSELVKINKTYELQKSNNSSLIESLKNCISSWRKYSHILLNETKLNELKKLKIDKANLDKSLSTINSIINEYKDVLEIERRMIESYNEEAFIALKKKKDKLLIEIENNEKKIADIKNGITQTKQLRIKLNNIAQSLLNNLSNKKTCPLCGHNYLSENELLNNINIFVEEYDDRERLLSEFEDNKLSLEKEIAIIEEQIVKNQEYAAIIQRLKELLAIIKSLNISDIATTIPEKQLLDECRKIYLVKERIINEAMIIKSKINIFENEGYYDALINEAEQFKQNNIYMIRYNNNLDSDITQFEKYLIDMQQDAENKNDTLNSQIKENETKIALCDLSDIENKIIAANDNITTLKSGLDIMRLSLSSVNSLKNYFSISDDISLVHWASDFMTSRNIIDVEVNKLAKVQGVRSLEEKLSELGNRKTQLQSFLNRCNEAIDAFDGLKELRDYSGEFIADNIKKIEYFFKALHTPREFTSLKVEDDMLVALRGKDGKLIRVFEMSTGQRVSLALAVMFSSYLAAPNAPKFILLDEPVANMDDLHLLNLLDILRDFAVYGTQIIFTTANPEVAGIFRRKFSFFGDRFKHFEMRRNNDDNTEIKVIKYSPKVNEGELLQIIS